MGLTNFLLLFSHHTLLGLHGYWVRLPDVVVDGSDNVCSADNVCVRDCPAITLNFECVERFRTKPPQLGDHGRNAIQIGFMPSRQPHSIGLGTAVVVHFAALPRASWPDSESKLIVIIVEDG
ncbi:hypothetical protein [Mycobacteroides abscessus]|uniref:hypothetical protein n=1 Tax=Mycobacteroides abscessus TaxID=36809 RepID=UPI00130004D6|nr:hypothetical protein [Mycobacteroides abscessus]